MYQSGQIAAKMAKSISSKSGDQDRVNERLLGALTTL
jgi:hypothetical protein